MKRVILYVVAFVLLTLLFSLMTITEIPQYRYYDQRAKIVVVIAGGLMICTLICFIDLIVAAWKIYRSDSYK